MQMHKSAAVFFAMAFAAISFAADDPLTGTWRELKTMTIAPKGNGLSIQNDKQKPQNYIYGKDVRYSPGWSDKYIRIDDHTINSTIKHNGKIDSESTLVASTDGKKLTRISRPVGSQTKSIVTAEYERIGSSEDGDAFSGTWRETTNVEIINIKIDGDVLEWTGGNSSYSSQYQFTTKLNGTESRGKAGEIIQAKRINAKKIELIRTPVLNALEKALYEVSGDTLFITTIRIKMDSPMTAPPDPFIAAKVREIQERSAPKTVREYERVK
jgi:hypothetical protein